MFIKTFKKSVSILVAILMLLSITPIGVFAAVWDGSNEPSFRGNSVYWSEETNSYIKDGKLTSSKAGAGSIILGLDGNYGKSSADKVYKTFDNGRTAVDYSGCGDFTLGGSSTNDLVREFSFAYDEANEDGSLIGSYFRFFKNMNRNTQSGNATYASDFLKITTSSIKFAGKNVSYDFLPHRWYNITMVFDTENKTSDSDADVGKYHYRAYVNGELIVDVPEYGTYYGTSTGRVLPLLNTVIYWDNLNSYAIDSSASAGFTCTKTPAASLTSNAANVVIDGESVIVPENMTVAKLRESVSSTADIKFYNYDYSAELDGNSLAIGANIVLTASSNDSDVYNTYTYYTVEKYVYKYDYLLDDTADYSRGGTKTGDPLALLAASDGNYGKSADDEVLMYTDASGNRYLQCYSTTKNTNIKDKQQVVYEFQAMVPNNGTGASFSLYMPDGEQEFAIRSDGLWKGTTRHIAELKPGTWNTFAFVSAGATAYSDATPTEFKNTYEVYVNGVMVNRYTISDLSTITDNTRDGLQRARIRGGNAVGDYTPTMFWDNMRFTLEEYNPNYDKLAVVTGKGIDGKTISGIEGTTIAELKNALTFADDTSMRVYDADYNLISDETQPMLNTYTVVFAAKNGTEMERSYSYYSVKYTNTLIGAEILNNGEIATGSYDADDVITVNVSFTNTDNSTHNVMLYVAQYKDGELVKLWSDDESVTNDGTEKTLAVSLSDMTDRAGSSIKIILLNGDTQNPYIMAKTLNCSVAAE